MNAHKGYYCLVQYCPDVARQEAVNIGVMLSCPELNFLRVRMVKSNQRIRRFFGEVADNTHHLNAMKEALENRLEIEAKSLIKLEELQTFIDSRANRVFLTNPKTLKVFDAEKDLVDLYNELVLDQDQSPVSLEIPELHLRSRVDAVLSEPKVRRFMQTNLTVEVPAFKRPLKVPYGFQNGRFNLIQPIEFPQTSEARITTAACKFAVEGHSLYKHRHPKLGALQLVIIAEFAKTTCDLSNVVRDILEESEVCMFTSDNLDELKQRILTTGKPIVSD